MTLIGCIANAFLIAGTVLITCMNATGYLLCFIGEALWVIEARRMGRRDLLFICVVFTALYAWGFGKWTGVF